MRKVVYLFIYLFSLSGFSQERNSSYIDINYFKGNIALHNDDIQHLIKGHPEGFLISWNKRTYGEEYWQQLYNYPDLGMSFIYQNFKNKDLGNNFGLYGHYNFYFLKRHIMLRIGQGLAYTTNPYDKEDNFRNVAFGSKILSSTYAMLNYKKDEIVKGLNAQVGLTFIHYSNANVRAPNTSINSMTFNFGLEYAIDGKSTREYIYDSTSVAFKEPIKYNLVFRSGINESDIIGSGQFPFYVFSVYADKRLNRKSAIQFGVDTFFSLFLKENIKFRSVAFEEFNVTGDEDYKRVGVFVGHELFFNKTTVLTQMGHYIHYPKGFHGPVYIRAGLKRYFGSKIFGSLTLKSHWAKAEAVELGIGVRL